MILSVSAPDPRNYADLVEAAEQTVRYCEEPELGEDLLAQAQ